MIIEQLRRGILSENPLFVLVLGLCPSLAVTTSLQNGVGLGLSVTLVLICSNCVISLLRNVIPEKVRIPSYMLIIASFVAIVQLFIHAFFPLLEKQLGIFIPLIVINCVVLGRAESYASKHKVPASLLDGIAIGAGFTLALSVLGIIREILGTNSLMGFKVIPEFTPMPVFLLAPGAFFIMALILVAIRFYNSRKSGVVK